MIGIEIASGLVELEVGTGADVQTPLDFAPFPDSRARRMFEPSTIAAHLEALAAAQQDDGGWTVPYPRWSEAASLEWRGVATIEALRILRANS
jgi:hypothetical protein